MWPPRRWLPMHLGAQVGQVAFEHRPVHPADPRDCRCGEKPGEPGDHEDRPAAGFQPQPADSRQRTQRLARSRSHGWGIPSNRRGWRPVEAEAAHPPDIARVFGFPAAGLGQIRDRAVSVDQQARAIGSLSSRTAIRSCQVSSSWSSSDATPRRASDRTTRMTTRGVSLPCRSSWRRCSDVLDLQLQLRGQPIEPDRLAGRVTGSRRSRRRTRRSSGRPLAFQVLRVGLAERRCRLRPQLAVRDAARSARSRLLDRRRHRPATRPGPADPLVAIAERADRTSRRGQNRIRSRHPAALVRALPPPPRIGRAQRTPPESGRPSSAHRCRCP